MKTSLVSKNFNRRADKGVALVLTLSIIVIATVVATAFFFRSRYDVQGTGSYTSQVTAKKLADLGAAQVTSTFLAEAVAGSDEAVEPGTADQKLFVSAENAKYMVPQKSNWRRMPDSNPANLASDPYLSVVRQSIPSFNNAVVAGKEISGGIQVSTIRTTEDAVNRDGLKGKFWGKPMLTSDGEDSFSDANAPNWIYVTANGDSTTTNNSSVKPSDADALVGRYAFNVYDVGGLLDANVAGFTEAGGQKLVRRKGSLIFADLAELASQVGAPLSAGDIAALNLWRYPDMGPGDWTPAADGEIPREKLDILLKSGAMLASLGKYTPGINPSIGRLNENTFLSREDMIRYFASVMDPSDEDMSNTRKLLPYLTHFSRDVNQPTFQWEWAEGRPKVGNTLYNSVGTNLQRINADAWDSSGKMRVARRFPLERLDLLTLKNGQPTGNANLIRKYFGLRWEKGGDGNFRWVYDPIVGGNVKLRSLDEVNPDSMGTPGMEPNFFEMLSASINAATLGQQFGGVAATVKGGWNAPHYRYPSGNQLQFDGQVDSHVMRIGAAIIDQWDSDNYPTEIFFNRRTIFGVEDLPYLHGFKRMNYYGGGPVYNATFNSSWTSKGGPASMTLIEGATLIHPQVWNPHSSNSGQATEGPTNFRVIPYVSTLEGDGSNNPKTYPPTSRMGTDFGRNPRVVDIGDINGSLRYDLYISSTNPSIGNLNWDTVLNNLSPADEIRFSGNADTFREPILLWKKKSASFSATSTPATQVDVEVAGPAAQEFLAKWLIYVESGKSFSATDTYLGFRIGKYLLENVFNTSTSNNRGFSQVDWVQYRDYLASQVRVNFALQYQGPNGWQTYDIMYDTVDFPDSNSDGNKVWRCVGFEHDATYRVDPRVERFGPQSQFYRATMNPMTSLGNFPPSMTGMRAGVSPLNWSFYRSGNGGDNGLNPYNASNSISPLTNLWKNLTASNAGSATGNNNNWENLNLNTGGGVRYLDPDGYARRSAGATGEAPSLQGNTSSRPIILNRKFQSVAEMAYASRDLPWRSVDFWHSNSGDSALLDYFCLYETDSDPRETPVIAGVLNLNTANPRVLASLISGGSVMPGETDQISFVDAKAIADELSAWTHSPSTDAGPFRSRADLVGSWKGSYVGPFTGRAVAETGDTSAVENSPALGNAVKAISNASLYESRRTNIMRALVDSTTVRTWNLMIDVVAQSGKVRPGGGLEDFVVEGQVRNWVFVSVDRITGKIVDMKTEAAD